MIFGSRFFQAPRPLKHAAKASSASGVRTARSPSATALTCSGKVAGHCLRALAVDSRGGRAARTWNCIAIDHFKERREIAPAVLIKHFIRLGPAGQDVQQHMLLQASTRIRLAKL
jgi:hypothetical protein